MAAFGGSAHLSQPMLIELGGRVKSPH